MSQEKKIIDFDRVIDDAKKLKNYQNGQEIKLAEGLYFVDNRTGDQKMDQELENQLNNNNQNVAMLQNLNGKTYNAPQNPILLEKDFAEFQSRIEKMQYSIDEMIKIENYMEDIDFVEAILENHEIISRYYEFQIKIVNKFIKMDTGNEFVMTHKVSDLELLQKQNKEANLKFFKEHDNFKKQNQNIQEEQNDEEGVYI